VEDFTTFSVPDKPFKRTHIKNIYERAIHHENSCLSVSTDPYTQ